MYIYDFPELKPGLRVGNIGWLREPTLFTKKLKGLGVRRIVLQPPLELYPQALQLGLPVVERSGLPLETGDLILYETVHVAGVAALTADFNVDLGPLGIILSRSSDAVHTETSPIQAQT